MKNVTSTQSKENRKTPDNVSFRRPLVKKGLESMTAHYIRQSFKPHAHDEYVLGIITGGVHSVWCRGKHNLVGAGTIVTMHPGDVHHGGGKGPDGWKQRMLYISETLMDQAIRDILDTDLELAPRFSQTFHENPSLARRFESFHQILHGSELTLAREIALNDILCLIINRFAPNVFEKQSCNNPEGRISDAIEFLHEHVEEDISLEKLCTISGLRRRQTIEAFKRKTGLPPHAYHIIGKIKAVKEMLQKGISATEAAALAGFSDQSHMTRHFVAVMGMTPKTYAKA